MERTNEVIKTGWYVSYTTHINGSGARNVKKFFETLEGAQAFYDKINGRLTGMKEDGLIDGGEIDLMENVKVQIVTFKETIYILDGTGVSHNAV
jgi:hypothetical protein